MDEENAQSNSFDHGAHYRPQCEDDINALTVLVQRMVNEAGEPCGFAARSWLDHWLIGEVRALGNRRPLDVLFEHNGLDVVSSFLLRAQSGAFS